MDDAALLVVEDSESAFEQVQQAAAQLGLRADWALNGAEALRLSRQRRYEAIVLDLYLPLLDGLSFLRIHRSESGTETPVVVISSTARTEQLERARALGVRAFVEKPIDADHLATLLRELLDQRAMTPPPTTSSPR